MRKRVASCEALEGRVLFALAPLPVAIEAQSFEVGRSVADPVRDVVYVADQTNRKVLGIDTNLGRTVTQARVNGLAGALATSLNGDRLFVAVPGASQIEVFALPDLAPLPALEVGAAVRRLVHAAGDKLYVVTPRDTSFDLRQVDARSGALGPSVVSAAVLPHGYYSAPLLRTNEAGTRVYARELYASGANTVDRYAVADPARPGFDRALNVLESDGSDFAVDEAGRRLYTSGIGAAGFGVFDLDAQTRTLLPVDRRSPGAVATRDDSPHLYGMTYSGIYRFDKSAGTAVNFNATSFLVNGPETLKMTRNGRAVFNGTNEIGILGAGALAVDGVPDARFRWAAGAGGAVAFDAGASAPHKAGETITGYSWNFGDGGPAGSGPTAGHAYAANGTYTVTLTVTASTGRSDEYVALVNVTNAAAPAALTLRAAADAYVRDGSYAGANYGGAADLVVKRSGTAGNTREAYLRFDLSSVPSVGSAKLRLFGRLSSTANASVTTAVHSATNTTWGEASLTWNTRPAAGNTSRGTVTVSGTTGKWYELDLTSFLRAEKAAGRNVVTLVLKNGTTTDAQTIFSSDENATVANRPQLVVTPAAPPPQGIVVSTSNLSVPEGGSAAFTVKLAAQPAANVVVNVAKSSTGDVDLSAATTTLTFTPANWNAARSVSVAAAQDADQANGTAAFTLSSAGLASKVVTAAEADNDAPAAVTLRAAADAYVRDGTYAGTNYGAATQLQAKQAGAGYYREGYLRFDLSGVATIGTAKLRLFGRLDNTSAASAGFTVYNSSNTTWSESAVTYNSRLTSGTTARGSGTVTGTTAKWYEVDLTSFLKAEKAAGRNVVTLVIKASAASPATVLFDSDEGANRPGLVITR